MRLSRALLVMLLLHVVAVGGWIASSRIRQHDLARSSADPATAVEADDSLATLKTPEAGRARSAPTAPTRPSVHVVRSGETLLRIANDNGVTLAALVAANGAGAATAPLRAGQELKLPDRSPDPSTQVADGTASALSLIEDRSASSPPGRPEASAPGSAPRPAKTPADAGANLYVVGKGESVYTIAQKLKVNADALMKLNQIDDPKKLRPGQKLRVPPAARAKGK